jgi:hypothetical protein
VRGHVEIRPGENRRFQFHECTDLRSRVKRACRLRMYFRIAPFTSARLFFPLLAKSASRTSSELNRPTLRTSTPPPCSSHSNSEPGPMPSFLQISGGTEIRPCAVTFDRAIAMTCNPYSAAGGTSFPTTVSSFFVLRMRSASSFSSMSMRPSYSARFRSL